MKKRMVGLLLAAMVLTVAAGCGKKEKALSEIKFEDGELFRRFTETHFQRGYTLEEMKSFVEKAGMQPVLFLDADTRKAPTENSERIYVVAKECQK